MNFVPAIPVAKISMVAMLHAIAVPPTSIPSSSPSPATAMLATFATSTGQVCTEPNPIAEIRFISGLTFEQLATMFAVTRRTVHLWMSGQRRLPAKEEQVQRILATLRRIDRGASDFTRAALLEDGSMALDLLAHGEYAAVEKALGQGRPARRRPPTPSQLLEERRPPPPADLVQANEEGPHPAIHSKLIKAWKIKKGREGT